MQKNRNYFAIFLIIVSAVGLISVATTLGNTTWNLTLTTNTDLESGLMAHWTFDGKDIDNSQYRAIRDRSGNAKHGINASSTPTKIQYITSSGSSNTANHTSDTFSYNHTSGNLLVASIQVDDTVLTDRTISGVTYNNVALTKATSSDNTSTGLNAEIWYLANPSTGTNNLVITYRGTVSATSFGAVSIANANTADLINIMSTVKGNSATPKVWATTTQPYTLLVESLVNSANVPGTAANGQVSRWNIDLGTENGAASTKFATATGATSTTWTLAGAEDFTMAIVAFNSADAGGAVEVPGKIGQALKFNGVDDYVSVGSVSASAAKTIAFWVNATDATSQKIIDLNGTYYVQTNASDQVSLAGAATVSSYVDGVAGASLLKDGKWHHVVLATAENVGVTAVDLGRVGSTYFSGKLDDIRIYSRVLSASEVNRLYHLGATSVVNKTIESDTDLKSGLVLHWPLDGKYLSWATSPAILDASGNSRNAIANIASSSASVAPGSIGQAVRFDGTGDYLQYQTEADLPTGDFTFSAWVNPDSAGLTQTLTDWGAAPGTANDDELHIRLNTTNKIEVYTNNTLRLTSAGWATSTEWSHIVVSREGANIRLYLNNSLDPTVGSDSTAFSLNCDALFGANNSNVTSCGETIGNDFKGRMDDIRIYNRALSASEINRLYHLGATNVVNKTITTNTDLENGLIHHYTFDGKNMNWSLTTAEVRDRGSSVSNGDASQTVNNVTSGVIGQGLDFPITGDGVAVANPGLPTAAFTYSAWIYPYTTNALGSIILESHTTGAAGGNILTLGLSSTPKAQVIVNGSGGTTVTGATTLPLYKWSHIAVTRAASGGAIKLYLNGIQDGSGTNATALTFGCDLTIGYQTFPSAGSCTGGGSLATSYDGKEDDVRIYNRELSASEILKLYQLGAK